MNEYVIGFDTVFGTIGKSRNVSANLIKLGVDQGQAYAWSRTRMGGWAVAQSPILGTMMTLAKLRRKDYLSMTDYYFKVKI